MKTLEFRVKDIHENTFDVHELPVSPTEIGLAVEEAQFVQPINGNIQLARRVNDVYVKADIAASIEVVCRRCTQTFESDVEAMIELQFYPAEKAEHVEPLLLDVGERYYSGESIDLSDEVRQALLLEIPIWPLCLESCQGLCPHCGVDRNTAPCGCNAPEGVVSPFAALGNLLNDSKRVVGE
ncbi:MAG: DUF177 domain-containing protein [Candidatus Poribacteria bacterium]|nr:DUF177 domain-containing protein [Candidatus Poribacteria bacterium]